MKMNFNYNKFESDTQNTLVDSFVALCEATIGGKQDSAEYKEANAQFSAEFMKECFSAIPNANVEAFTLDTLKNPMVNSDIFFQHRFDAILAQMITPVVPMVIASGYADLYDVTQVGFGDNAKYTVDSNEMFIVHDSAEGITRGGVLTTYNTEYTVTAQKKEVAAYVDLITRSRIS